MHQHFDNILSKYRCHFRKGYNLLHCLITLIGKWCESVDKVGAFGTLWTDLSKSFDGLPN